MKYNFILFIGLILLMGLVSASDYLPHKQNTNLSFSFTDSIAGSCTVTTMDKPDGTTVFLNQDMTVTGDTFNITISGGNFTELGTHCINIDCADGYGDVCREVTATGESFDISQSVMLFAQFGIIIMFLIISFAFDKTKWKIRNLFHMFAIFMGIILLNSIRVIAGTSASLSSMADIGLVSGIIILIFMFLFTLINYTIEVFLYFKQRRKMRWEIKEQV